MCIGFYLDMPCLTRCLFNHVLAFGWTMRADTFHARANSVPVFVSTTTTHINTHVTDEKPRGGRA
jgi:hypothetical protein